MPDDKPKEGQDTQKPESEQSIPKERFEQVWARAKAAEEKLEKLSKAQEEDNRKRLEDDKKFKELYEQQKAKVESLTGIERAVEEYFGSEIADLTEEQKGLIPDAPVHNKLSWVKRAKALGLFGKKQDPPQKTFDGKPRTGMPPDKWYLEIKSSDPRFPTLSPAQYAEWKSYNKAKPAGFSFKGGF